jgi:CubicO group peptidase (beta-lactamase class C family)
VAPQTVARLQRGQSLPPAELEAFVDGQIARAMADEHVAGVAVAIVQNGQLVMEKGYGPAAPSPIERLDPRKSLVRLGSGSQIFTWIAALKAVEEGKLNLDAPIDTALPDALKIPDEGFDKPILFRHLMSHTAGFEDRALGRRYVHEAEMLRPLDIALKTMRPRRVRGAGLMSIPSDYGVALAGDIVARLEGRPFDQLIESEILRPLGLNHTSFREPYPAGGDLPDPLDVKLADAMASGFRWTGHGFEPQALSYGQSLAPAIAASTTADDMARLMIALLNNGKLGDVSLYNGKTAALLRTPLQRPAPGMDGWAHGLAMTTFPSGFQALSDIGASPDFRSNLTVVPGLNFGIFVVANTDTGALVTRSLPNAIVQRFYGSPSPTPPPAAEPDADYAGSYLSAKRAYHGLEAFADRLTEQSTLAPDAAGGIVVSNRREAQPFAPTSVADEFTSADGVGLITPSAHGRTQAYVIGSGGGAAERVGGLHSLLVLRFWAGATVLTILASFAGLFIRDRVDPRETRAQVVANVTQIITCVAWSLAFATFALFAKEGLSPARMMFEWPNKWLVIASWSALAAGLLSFVMVTQLPGAWREERRIHGWSVWRKLRHTTTIGVFLIFTAVLAAWGALEPWSS